MHEDQSIGAELLHLHGQRIQINEMLQNPDVKNGDLLETALSQAETKILSLASEMTAPLVDEINELNKLDIFVESGLLDAAEVAARKESVLERIQSDERIALAWKIVNGAQFAETVKVDDDVSPVATDHKPVQDVVPETSVETEVSAENVKPSIKITLRQDAIQIGKNGKYVKTSETAHSRQKDYSKDRIALLRALIETQGEMKPVMELWAHAFGDREFDTNTMRAFRNWATKLTFRKAPIVKYNGRRGPGSKYGIVGYNIELINQEVVRKTAQPQPEHVHSPEPEATTKVHDSETTKSPSEEETAQEQIRFPLSLFDSSLVATFLNMNAEYLKSNGINPLDTRIADTLHEKITDKIKLKAVAESKFSSLAEMRLDALQRLKEFFNDDDAVFDTMDTMCEQDDRYELFSYLFDLDGEERWITLEELVTAQRSIRAAVATGKFDGYRVLGSRKVITLNTPEGIKVFEDSDIFGDLALTAAEVEVDTSGTDTPEAEIPAPDDTLEQPSDPSEEKEVAIVPDSPKDEVQLGSDAEVAQSPEVPRWFEEIQPDIDSAIVELAEKGLLDDALLSANAASLRYTESRTYGTQEAVHRLEKNGLASTKGTRKDKIGEVLLDRVARVVMLFQNNHPHILSQKNRRKVLINYIELKLNDYLTEPF